MQPGVEGETDKSIHSAARDTQKTAMQWKTVKVEKESTCSVRGREVSPGASLGWLLRYCVVLDYSVKNMIILKYSLDSSASCHLPGPMHMFKHTPGSALFNILSEFLSS